jgi:hypothetical protein
MKTNIFSLTVILLASLLLGACSGDDDNTTTGSTSLLTAEWPEWDVDLSYNQEQPNWQKPMANDYENFTVVRVEIEDALKPAALVNDLMAVFVGDELRGLSGPAFHYEEGTNTINPFIYVIKVFGNEPDLEQQDATLCYYSSYLRQVFTCPARISFGSDVTNADGNFTYGSPKFPVIMDLTMNVAGFEAAGIVPVEGDQLAVFVGDESRGFHLVGESLFTEPIAMRVFGRKEGETVTVKYFNAASKRIFTFNNTVTLTPGAQSITLNI